MEQAVGTAPITLRDTVGNSRPLVFLDTNVIIGYLGGEPSAVQVFRAEAEGRIRFAINEIVLQELLLAANGVAGPEFNKVWEHFRIIPIDLAKAEALVQRVRALRKRITHSNNILILSSADECDFLVTDDAEFKALATADMPRVLTPAELAIELRAA
jgi:predicted nucleic acid-binding protein